MRRLRVLVVLLAGTVLFLLLGAPRPQDLFLANEIVEIAVNLSVEANGISEPDSIPVGDATLIAFLGLSFEEHSAELALLVRPGCNVETVAKINDISINAFTEITPARVTRSQALTLC